MRKLPILSRLLPLPDLFRLSIPLSMLLAAAAGLAQAQTSLVPGPENSAPIQNSAPVQELFPGDSASPATTRFPGYAASRADSSPLSALPYVYALKRRDPGQMSAGDAKLAAALDPEIKKEAALMSFDLSRPGWSYQQIVCPALPDYLLLSFRHGSDPGGSSRFTAVLERDGSQVQIVSTFAHGMKPFAAAWSKPSTFGLFNRMLRQERGTASLAAAPNWLVIGLCYAELSGYPVQALTSKPDPGPTMDLQRLQANLPQMQILPDRSAQITFSDVSQPAVTTTWALLFNKRGQLVRAERHTARQPAPAALRP